MSKAHWFLEGGRILIKDHSGAIIFPSALDIYSAIFSDKKSFHGQQLDIPLIEVFPDLIFSRFPVEAGIKVSSQTPSLVSVKVGIWSGSEYFDLPEGHDQIIIGSKWYPVSINTIHSTKEWLTERDIVEGTSLSLGKLIKLRSLKDVPAKLIDESLVVASDVASVAGGEMVQIQGLNANLYPYQHDGVGFLTVISQQDIGCIFADEMGLGKTLQVIALLLSEKNRAYRPSLVVAPATIVENWRREILKFAPSLTVYIHAGPGRAGIPERLTPFDVVVTSFDTVIRDEPLLGSIEWNLLVLDEAQAIKNPDAQRTKAVKRLPRRVSLAVTGTPVENRLDDLWSLADFALPGLLGSVSEFRSIFSDDFNDASRLSKIVSPIILRREVKDVAKDLPEKIEVPQAITMSAAQADAYESLRLITLAENGPTAGLIATGRLRMFCTHPRIISISDGDPSLDVNKYIRLLELLTEIFESNQKALVFTTYRRMVDLFMLDIPLRWPSGFFRFIDGRVPVAERQPTVDQFYEFNGYGALFLNPKASIINSSTKMFLQKLYKIFYKFIRLYYIITRSNR
jgi:SNF2 family DNA or RNA helicase